MAIQVCTQDENCPGWQYCYTLSGNCVNYTECSRYNRLETEKKARTPFQCGLCMDGYTTEPLPNEAVLYCSKKIHPEDSLSSNQTPILICIGVVCSLMIIAIIAYCMFRNSLFKSFFKSWNCCKRKISKESDGKKDVTVINKSASPEENKPFIKCKAEQPPQDIAISINKYVGATVWRPPYWVNNANYGTNRVGDDDNDGNFNHNQILNHNHDQDNNVSQLQIANNMLNNNNPMNVAITIPETNADQDNARNRELETYVSDDNNTNNYTDTDDYADSIFGSNEKVNDAKTFLINQTLGNISMNVHLISVNDKCQKK